MIIDKNFSPYAVFSDDNILSALNKISQNKSRIVFAVSETGYLEGILSDGDIRRWLTTTSEIDLERPVSTIINRDFVSAQVTEEPAKIAGKLSNRILLVPLIDANRRLVAVASADMPRLQIGDRTISDDDPTFFIAEIGNNHNGDVELAYRLIDEAADAGADCAKFQMRDMTSLYAVDASSPSADLGAQYTLDLLARFQLSDDDLMRAFDHALSKNLLPLCTPWDVSSFEKLERYGINGYKIASADFTNYDLLAEVSKAGKPLLCSTGMARESEVVDGVQILKNLGAPFALLHCNSTYPAPFKDVNMRYLERLKELSSGPVGYSGHERDIFVAISAISLGARIIEKHFTLDRTMEGNDHKVSLLPQEFARMVEGARQVEEALGAGEERTLSQGELMNRETLAKSIAAAVDIPAGAPITEQMLRIVSPGQGLQPNRKRDLLGRQLSTSKVAGDLFFESDLGESDISARDYAFPLPWGVPVRYHDFDLMRSLSNLDLVEIHLSYKDLELDFREYIPAKVPLDLVVHAPELFEGDHTLDLCAAQDEYRRRSLEEVQRVIELTRDLSPYFRTERPIIVTNVGGFSGSGHLDDGAVLALIDRLLDSLEQLDCTGVEIVPQTMPPYPWHFGGQQFHNLFVKPEQIDLFCRQTGMRICLDTSHSRLAANHFGIPFSVMLDQLLPHTAHLHVADARGVDGEGIQIGDGEIDWPSFWSQTLAHNATPSFIPEIWQGHKNRGEGAWRALDRLENFLGLAATGAQTSG